MGYLITKTKDGTTLRSTLLPDTTAAHVVKRAFEESISAKGLKEIAKGLNKDGILTKSGKKWSSTGVYTLLTNEAYMGTLVWGKRSNITPVRVENAWPAIVDREIFYRVQSLLT